MHCMFSFINKICCIVLLALSTISVGQAIAQEQKAPVKSVQAPAITNLKKLIQDMNAFTACFYQEVTNQQGEVLVSSSGKIYLTRPDLFLMHTVEPDEVVLFTKEQNIYYFDASLNQVNVIPFKKMEHNPFLLLTNIDELNWSDYIVSQDENRFTLIPNTPQEIRSITLAFEQPELEKNKVLLLKSISLRMEDGNTNFYNFSKRYSKVDKSVFDYKLPDDVEWQ